MRRCSKAKPKTKVLKIRNHVNRNNAVVNLEKNKLKDLVVKLQKLDLETIKQFSNDDHVNTREYNLYVESIENVKDTERQKFNSRREKILQKKEGIYTQSNCTYFNDEKLSSSVRLKEKYPIVKLKKLSPEVIELYLIMNLLKNSNKPIVKVKKLDLNTIEQNSSDCSTSKRLTNKNSKVTTKGILKKRSCQSTVRTRSQRIEKKEESISTNPAVSNIQRESILPPNPCKNGCDRVCELISEERRYQLNRHFQSLNSPFEKAAFLNNIIRYRWDEDQEIVLCYYYININGINQRVCLNFLLATLNIEIEFIMNHIKKIAEINKSTFFQQKSNLS